MDFNLKQWRDQQQQEQHESEDEQQQHSAKIPKYFLLESPQQHQQHPEIAALPLFVSSESQPNKITTTHFSEYPDHHSSNPPTAIPTRFPSNFFFFLIFIILCFPPHFQVKPFFLFYGYLFDLCIQCH